MKITAIVALVCACLAPAASAFADEEADGTIQPISLPSGSFQYNITLQNTGTTTLGSFWFSWVPGLDFLPSQPTNVHSPAGWTPNVISPTYDGDGYSIQWIATTPLPAGQSLPGFSFTSTDDPDIISGTSPIYFDYYLTNTSYAYIGAPETDIGTSFNPTVLPTIAAAPEPTTLSLAGIGIAGLLVKRRRTT